MGYAYLNKGDMKAAIGAFQDFLKHNTDEAKAQIVQGLIDSLSGVK
jgi:hypothetical protein